MSQSPPPPPPPPPAASHHPSKVKLRTVSPTHYFPPSTPPPRTGSSVSPTGVYFFYGTLADPLMLREILGLESEPPRRPASLTGYKCMLWGQYPALLDGSGSTVEGVACYIQTEAQAAKLAAYETDHYHADPCRIDYTDEKEPAQAMGYTFRFVGNHNDLSDEEASTGRAGCQNKECKDQKVKIAKGELRCGTWVESERIKSWMWRHWGCVTPKLIVNLNEAVEELSPDDKDPEALDGFEDLQPEFQQKIVRALKQGHVDDEDWKGDVEMNRPGKTGFRVRVSKKKAAAAAAEDDSEAKSPEKPKKRGRAKAKDEDDEEKPPTAKKSRKSKAAEPSEDEDELSDESDAQPKKAAKRGRPAKKATEKKVPKANSGAKVSPVGADGETAQEKPKRGRKKKTA
ncbi:hypothetical protein FE257_012537 [Aspergillus nanangensis]|uniref:Putative gamma-glutamylcyclotransferase n=1 Tax=Aspergillus nanangensis TaxID=2582783 RepID=A0AAD4GXQ2_ASPNN|nr:hypothetical protein FE257_012537 [Aspergillus nanangensis]